MKANPYNSWWRTNWPSSGHLLGSYTTRVPDYAQREGWDTHNGEGTPETPAVHETADAKQTEGRHSNASKVGSTSEGTPEIRAGRTSAGNREVEGSQTIPSEETNTDEDAAMTLALRGWKSSDSHNKDGR